MERVTPDCHHGYCAEVRVLGGDGEIVGHICLICSTCWENDE